MLKTFEKTPYRPLHVRKLKDLAVRVFSYIAIGIAIGMMCWILFSIVKYGSEAINWTFLTCKSKPYGIPDAGMANALLGTFMITACAGLISIPLGILAGIYLSEYGSKNKIGPWLRFCANVLMGIPSVIIGLFIYAIVVVTTGHFSGFAGAIALSIIMFPLIMRTTEDMLLMVPTALRESALALGMTRARTTLCIVCRAAKNGLLTGILLSVARVSGETAPLLFTALFSDAWPTSFFSQPTANVPVLITEYATNSPFESMHTAGWGAALVITLVVLSINIIARTFFKEKKYV